MSQEIFKSESFLHFKSVRSSLYYSYLLSLIWECYNCPIDFELAMMIIIAVGDPLEIHQIYDHFQKYVFDYLTFSVEMLFE